MSVLTLIGMYIVSFIMFLAFYPIIRVEVLGVDYNRNGVTGQMEGETGVVYILRAILTGLFWPVLVSYLVYRKVRLKLIPWLITPKQ